jgi:hypothetical protein
VRNLAPHPAAIPLGGYGRVILPTQDQFKPGAGFMPLVNIKLIEGVFSQDQKREMIRRMTDGMVDLEGEH